MAFVVSSGPQHVELPDGPQKISVYSPQVSVLSWAACTPIAFALVEVDVEGEVERVPCAVRREGGHRVIAYRTPVEPPEDRERFRLVRADANGDTDGVNPEELPRGIRRIEKRAGVVADGGDRIGRGGRTDGPADLLSRGLDHDREGCATRRSVRRRRGRCGDARALAQLKPRHVEHQIAEFHQSAEQVGADGEVQQRVALGGGERRLRRRVGATEVGDD